jgi:hypothetical protein
VKSNTPARKPAIEESRAMNDVSVLIKAIQGCAITRRKRRLKPGGGVAHRLYLSFGQERENCSVRTAMIGTLEG